MNPHAKASSIGSIRQGGRFGRMAAGAFATCSISVRRQGRGAPSAGSRTTMGLLALLAALSGLLLLVAPAFAATVTDERPLLFTFNGSDTESGSFSGPMAVEVDQANGLVYVIDSGHGAIDKFNLAGMAQPFSATGSSSLAVGGLEGLADIAVDNSGTNAGRIYAMGENGPVRAFSPAGSSLWELGGFGDNCGLAVDASGHPWVGDYSEGKAREYDSSGSPPAEIGSVPVTSGNPCRLDVDASGNLYVNLYGEGVDKYEGGSRAGTVDATPTNAVTVDQSSPGGHVFTAHVNDFNEYEADGTLVNTFGTAGGFIGSGAGIAYDQTLDRVYVSDVGANAVEVFGPAASGTVPDATTESATVGRTNATVEGKANPLSLPASSYRFEWKEGTESGWWTGESSPWTSLPAETAEIPVSESITGLRAGATYQARLVTRNDENDLLFYSTPIEFTPRASAPPAVTIGSPSFTSTSAHVTGTIDPREDETTWQVEKSSGPGCASGSFSAEPTQTIPAGETDPVDVEWDLEGLFPAEHYCVQISATNTAGSTTSEVKEFTTPAVAPTQVFTAFAAPRTDTTARLNGYVNPEGSAFTYHFEYSADGGANWISLPEVEDSSGERRQIVVGEEVTGLQPQTHYSYRFVVESDFGPQSDEGTFETRSTAEMQLPQRGIELVNKPDKGNQNLSPEEANRIPLVSADGERVIWNVLAGAPGGTTGTEVNFLSIRTPSGWKSQPLAPPAAQQVGGGTYAYALGAATPDFRTFVMRPALTGALQLGGPPTWVRVSDTGQQDVLKEFSHVSRTKGIYDSVEMTADGTHVLIGNPETHQVEDIGSGSPEVVSIMPDGQPSTCGLEPGNFSGLAQGTANAYFRYPETHRMATTDGSRLYFQAMPNGGTCEEEDGHHPAIYFRNRSTGQTKVVDPGTGAARPALIRATPDGRSVIFITDIAHSPEDHNTTGDIYRWDEDGERYTCLTCVVPEAGLPESGGIFGNIGVSDDFSHVYFQSRNQLIPGHGTAGFPSIYSLHDQKLSYVAPLGGDVFGGYSTVGARISHNGNVLLFTTTHLSYSQLTADEQADECKTFRPGITSLNPEEPNCAELFRYEDSTNSLECLSCQPHGVTSHDIPNENEVVAVSHDGQTVAFVTRERLLPQDINNDEDVYEWHNGAVGLITDGESPRPSHGIGTNPHVFGMDASGNNIFFTVVQPGWTGYEQDGFANLYDARVGGGFPRPTEVAHCTEESCQGPLQPAPPGAGVGSSEFSGAGNERSGTKKRCAAKHGKKHHRCGRRHRHKHEKHRRHHQRPSETRSEGAGSPRGSK